MIRLILELLRIVLIFGILGSFAWSLVSNLYTWNDRVFQFQWLAALGIYVLLFIFYRNKWQFTGWYRGRGREMLPRNVTVWLSVVSAVLMAAPFLLSLFLS
ncbi:hypothetical protein [Halobacillus andaensis]|uniref:hypothetical protein n=1 Tax=Halobacillus andaensis TaxID=1176239 RepID=UPI003D760CFC